MPARRPRVAVHLTAASGATVAAAGQGLGAGAGSVLGAAVLPAAAATGLTLATPTGRGGGSAAAATAAMSAGTTGRGGGSAAEGFLGTSAGGARTSTAAASEPVSRAPSISSMAGCAARAARRPSCWAVREWTAHSCNSRNCASTSGSSPRSVGPAAPAGCSLSSRPRVSPRPKRRRLVFCTGTSCRPNGRSSRSLQTLGPEI